MGQFRLVSFVRRTQGLIVKPGNPKRIEEVADLCRADVRMVNRQRGSGTRALLEFLISAEGLDRRLIDGYENEEVTHGAVAALVAGQQADAGMGVQAAAVEYRLDFVPLVVERYYLACRAEFLESAPMRQLVEFLRTERFAAIVAALPGYAVDQAGTVLEALEAEEAPSGNPVNS
jgi:molybdate-binding protein